MAQEIADSKLLDTWGSSGTKIEPDISKIIEGWQLGEQPPHEYMNWLQNTFGSKLNHILKNGIAEWNNETEYLAGATVQHSGSIWLCKTTNTKSEPTDLNANWEKVAINKDLTLTVDTLADLRSISYPANTVWASGYSTKNDGAFGSHIFRLKGVKTTETDNSGTIIIATIGGVDYVYELQYDGSVNVKWFGAKGDGVTDDTVAIQNSFNSLKSKSYAGTFVYRGVRESIIFDYGKYLISAEITVPSSYITILGEGAILTAMTNDFICFKIPSNAWHFKLIGLKFEYFNTAFYVNSSNLDTGTNIIDSCVFLNCYDMALYIDAQSSITNIRNCRFVGNKKAIHVERGDVVTFKDSLVTSGTGIWSLTEDYDGQFVIKAGQFYAKNILTVPLPQTAGALEVCWFKNYANLYIDNVRFGGESGSFSPVNNFKGLGSTNEPSKLTIKNSNCYSVVPNLEAPAIRLFDVPNILTLEDNIGFSETKMIQFSSSVTNPGELISSNRYIISIKKNGFPTYLSSLPKELLPFLNEVSGAYRPNDSIGESIWKKGVSIGNDIIITLNHIDDRDRVKIGRFPIVNLEYTSNKNPAGGGSYRGMLHGKISTVIRFQASVSYVLEFHPIINRASTDTVPVEYTVTLAWAETGTRFLPITSTNFEYTVTIDKSSADNAYRVYQDGAIPKTASNINLI